MKKFFKSFMRFAILIAIICVFALSSCRHKAVHGHGIEFGIDTVRIDSRVGHDRVVTYKGHTMSPNEVNCSPDCPKCRENMRQLITEVIDSINHSK